MLRGLVKGRSDDGGGGGRGGEDSSSSYASRSSSSRNGRSRSRSRSRSPFRNIRGRSRSKNRADEEKREKKEKKNKAAGGGSASGGRSWSRGRRGRKEAASAPSQPRPQPSRSSRPSRPSSWTVGRRASGEENADIGGFGSGGSSLYGGSESGSGSGSESGSSSLYGGGSGGGGGSSLYGGGSGGGGGSSLYGGGSGGDAFLMMQTHKYQKMVSAKAEPKEPEAPPASAPPVAAPVRASVDSYGFPSAAPAPASAPAAPPASLMSYIVPPNQARRSSRSSLRAGSRSRPPQVATIQEGDEDETEDEGEMEAMGASEGLPVLAAAAAQEETQETKEERRPEPEVPMTPQVPYHQRRRVTFSGASPSAGEAFASAMSPDRFLHSPTARKGSTAPSSSGSVATPSSAAAAEGEHSIFLLLLEPNRKIFELIQVAYDPSVATVGAVLDLIPIHASEPALGRQEHSGLLRPRDDAEMNDLLTLASDARIRPGEVLVPLPRGCDPSKCRKLAKVILKTPNVRKLLSREDPLATPPPSQKGRTRTRSRSRDRGSKKGGNKVTVDEIKRAAREEAAEAAGKVLEAKIGEIERRLQRQGKDEGQEEIRRQIEEEVQREVDKKAALESLSQSERIELMAAEAEAAMSPSEGSHGSSDGTVDGVDPPPSPPALKLPSTLGGSAGPLESLRDAATDLVSDAANKARLNVRKVRVTLRSIERRARRGFRKNPLARAGVVAVAAAVPLAILYGMVMSGEGLPEVISGGMDTDPTLVACGAVAFLASLVGILLIVPSPLGRKQLRSGPHHQATARIPASSGRPLVKKNGRMLRKAPNRSGPSPTYGAGGW